MRYLSIHSLTEFVSHSIPRTPENDSVPGWRLLLLRSIADDKTDLLACIVMRLLPYRLFLAFGVPRKGPEPLVAARLARFVEGNWSCALRR